MLNCTARRPLPDHLWCLINPKVKAFPGSDVILRGQLFTFDLCQVGPYWRLEHMYFSRSLSYSLLLASVNNGITPYF